MKKRTLATILALSLCFAMFAACSGDKTEAPAAPAPDPTPAATPDAAEPAAPAPDETPAAEPASGDLLVYGIYKAGDQTWFIDEGDAAKAAVEELGGAFTYVDAKMSPEEELKAIDNAIANKASGIVMCTSDQTLSQAVVDKCNEAGIPVVAADDALEDGSGAKLAPWVGINGYVIGEANGAWLADYVKANDLAGNAECGLLIMTMDTVSSCVPRAEGEFDKFTELVPEFDSARIFKADYDGTTEKGNTVAAAIFTAHPEIKVWLVTGANEEGTIGAVRALETAGLDADACVVGLGAYMAKDEWNNKGADGTAMKAAAYFSSDSVGRGSVEVLMQIINGETPPLETAVDAIVVTPENYKEVMGKAAD